VLGRGRLTGRAERIASHDAWILTLARRARTGVSASNQITCAD
jgi:hypothetical protein